MGTIIQGCTPKKISDNHRNNERTFYECTFCIAKDEKGQFLRKPVVATSYPRPIMGLFFVSFLLEAKGGFSLMNGFEQALHLHLHRCETEKGSFFYSSPFLAPFPEPFLISESKGFSRPPKPVFGDSMLHVFCITVTSTAPLRESVVMFVQFYSMNDTIRSKQRFLAGRVIFGRAVSRPFPCTMIQDYLPYIP